jgi:hypothetical protein
MLLKNGIAFLLMKMQHTGHVAWAGQKGGAILLSLIFFATFLHQGKKVGCFYRKPVNEKVEIRKLKLTRDS